AVEQAWRDAQGPAARLAAKDDASLRDALRRIDAAKAAKPPKSLAILALALGAALAGGLWLERPHLFQDIVADHVAPRGERRAVTLADGSTALLDADSALDEAFGAERRVRLLRGAAYFEVKTSATPFVVETRDAETRVLGTGFEVRLLEHGGAVTLAHGAVAVRGHDGREARLAPGDAVAFGPQGVGRPAPADVDGALAWRGGRFVFYRMRLADVARQIERYRPGRIVVASGELADERITGTLDLSDTDAALESLKASVGFRVTALTGRLVILRR
ncbi:FecR family protein, partial [Methylopila musalis]